MIDGLAKAACHAVEILHGPHELEILEAAAACWVKDQKMVQVTCQRSIQAAAMVTCIICTLTHLPAKLPPQIPFLSDCGAMRALVLALNSDVVAFTPAGSGKVWAADEAGDP